ncbi:uncharacterized protein LOC131160169 [Malania oleifera]|uniref:uncharacterized protein LOC131160169 n=1 Tax=Malania oleifera TaxID=397392 RepID=UPI0025AEAB26|nr:uncharacterized protein LOC131160169 [Malania oleifera]
MSSPSRKKQNSSGKPSSSRRRGGRELDQQQQQLEAEICELKAKNSCLRKILADTRQRANEAAACNRDLKASVGSMRAMAQKNEEEMVKRLATEVSPLLFQAMSQIASSSSSSSSSSDCVGKQAASCSSGSKTAADAEEPNSQE